MAYRPNSVKERIIHRLKITQGHLKKIQQMIEDDQYCIHIIHQSHAVQKALKEVDNLILEEHLKGCVTKAIVGGNKDKAINELLDVLKKSN